MMRRFSSLLPYVPVGVIAALAACSLEAPKPHSLRIVIEDAANRVHSPVQSVFTMNSTSGFSTLATPSTTSDFTCFAVNVTGGGIGLNQQFFAGCNSPDNFAGRGPGVISPPVPRGTSIELDVPAGPARRIDVYGLYPPSRECGGTGNSQGYYLGGITQDLTDNTSVTVPIAYSSAAAANAITCNTGTAGPAFKYYVYAAGGGQILAMNFDPVTGSLSDIGTYSASGIQRITGVPGRTYIYGSNGGSSASIFAIANTTGALTGAGSNAFAGSPVTKMAVSSNGSFLWGLAGTVVSPMSIDATTGWLTPATSSPITSSQAMFVHPNSTYAYLADTSSIGHFTINSSTGALTRNASILVSGLVSIAGNGVGQNLFAISTGNVYGYMIDATTGGLTSTGSATISGNASALVFGPNGHMYAVLSSFSSIQKIDLTTASGPAPAGSFPTSGTGGNAGLVDPSGSYLLVSNGTSSNISVMHIDTTTGGLSAPTLHTVPFSPTDIYMTKIPQ